MTHPLSPAQRQELQAALLARRAALSDQRSAHLDGHSRVEHARELLLQDGDDATQRDAEREVDFARTDRDAVLLATLPPGPYTMQVRGKTGGGEVIVEVYEVD